MAFVEESRLTSRLIGNAKEDHPMSEDEQRRPDEVAGDASEDVERDDRDAAAVKRSVAYNEVPIDVPGVGYDEAADRKV